MRQNEGQTNGSTVAHGRTLADAMKDEPSVDELRVENSRLAADNRALAERLSAIETSTSWRAMVMLHRAIWYAKALAGRIIRTAGDGARSVRRAFTPPPVDPDVMETCLVPTWQAATQTWRLALDTQRLKTLQRVKVKVAEATSPYVVKPVRTPRANAKRPVILHVIANVYMGGSTQLVIDLLENLADRFEQDVATAALWRGGAHEGMVTHHFPTPLKTADFAALLESRKPDIVHVHYWGLTDDPWYRATIQAAANFPCKIIENINTPIAPFINPRIDHYIYVSEYVRERFGTGADDAARSSVIHPGIDFAHFDGAINEAETADAIGMVYRLENDKLRPDSIQLFIEVARRRPRTKIYIIGGGSLFRTYVEQTKAAGVRENFHFTGYVPYHELPAWYDKFSIFVAPVWQESFGQVSVFGMNKKQAVAGFKVGALPEILGYEDTFGDDIPSAARKIVDLLDDPVRRRALGEQNRRRAQSAFSVTAMTNRYGEIYDRLLAERP
jgi:glycosyltransferase involved in cell wall biosynthesis